MSCRIPAKRRLYRGEFSFRFVIRSFISRHSRTRFA